MGKNFKQSIALLLVLMIIHNIYLYNKYGFFIVEEFLMDLFFLAVFIIFSIIFGNHKK